ncbi:MAG: ATP-binding protein, partial [Acidobacteria bacterium]|nr:ATP-binding protein [Acidobacteriota bacterium]
MNKCEFENPFRPGAGHRPPHLAGRTAEIREFERLLSQKSILENLVLTGLRGVGKTVLLDTLKPLAIREGWMWAGTDLSESASVSEESLVLRLLTDLSVVTSSITISRKEELLGFTGAEIVEYKLGFNTLRSIYEGTPGLVADKLKFVLEFAWQCIDGKQAQGVVFAYDEAQNLADRAGKEQYPLSMLLDVFQSIQKKDIRFMLVLAGLPALFTQLVDARTYAERMFRVIFLDRLNQEDSREAVLRPIAAAGCPVKLREKNVARIVALSGGYPYFLQFISREVYDALIQRLAAGKKVSQRLPFHEILHKLDNDFFTGRWTRATERQRELLTVVAGLEDADAGFTL